MLKKRLIGWMMVLNFVVIYGLAGIAEGGVPIPDLVAHWKFDQGQGDIA